MNAELVCDPGRRVAEVLLAAPVPGSDANSVLLC
jgi:hypothetical protein